MAASLSVQFYDDRGRPFEEPKLVHLIPGDILNIHVNIFGKKTLVATVSDISTSNPELENASDMIIESFPRWNPDEA